jgi:hypothetical protein
VEQLPAVQLALARQQFAPRGLVDEGPYHPGLAQVEEIAASVGDTAREPVPVGDIAARAGLAGAEDDARAGAVQAEIQDLTAHVAVAVLVPDAPQIRRPLVHDEPAQPTV